MTCAFDRSHEHPLVLGTGAGDSLRDDAALFRDKPLEFLLGLVVDVVLLVVAEAACTFLSHLSGRAALW